MTETTEAYEQLLELYNDIDAFLRQQYGGDRYADHGFLIQELAGSNRIIAKHQQEMRAIAQLRNTIIHNPFGPEAKPLAQPHPAVVSRYKAIRNALLLPYDALSIAIPAQKMYSANLTSNLASVLKDMNTHIYTHVPIIEDGAMVGVFSENTLLSYLADSGDAIITKDMTMADFSDYLPLKSHQGESFIFLPRKASLSEVFAAFNAAIHDHRRIGMLFITEHGKEQEKPLGILTAWDLASPDLEL